MNSGEQFFLAIKSYGLAFQNLDKYNIWKLVILPCVLSLIIAVVVAVLAWITADDILLFVSEKLMINEPDKDYSRIIELTIAFVIHGATLFVYLKLYRYLVLIFLSPVFVNIARVLHEKESNDQTDKFGLKQYCFCSFRGIKIALKNLVYELLISILATFIVIIVVWISPLLPFIMLIIESYFFSATILDYHYEMKGNNMAESNSLIKKNTPYIMGNGLVFNFILLIPILGVIFAPILALVASYSGLNFLKNQYDDGYNLNKSVLPGNSSGI